MKRRLVIQALAEDDITQAANWYQDQRDGLGEEFLAEVEAALQLAVAHPRQFPCVRRKPEVRRVLTRRFPYRIFFVFRPEVVVVFRVLHGARDEGAWQGHLPSN
jgi:toxin ParE1/3/4